MRKRFYAAALSTVLSVSMIGNAFAGWSNSMGKWIYETENQAYLKDQWIQDGLHWYHVDKDGIMQTGWFQDTDGRWYYLDKNVGGPQGAMKTGWFQDTDGKWYWLNTEPDGSRGSMLTGWHWINEKCYYLQADGSCLMNGTTPDGYTVDVNGAWTVNGVVQTRPAGTKVVRGGGGGGGGSSSHSSSGSSDTPVYPSVYVGDTVKTYGWTQDADTSVYYVTPGTYQDVYVTSDVGNGEAVLENVAVRGNLTVQGGGSNSVKLKSGTSVSGRVIMDKAAKGNSGSSQQIPRLELCDDVHVGYLEVKQKAMIEAASSAASFGTVDVQADTVVKGEATTVESLQVNKKADVNISQARVAAAVISQELNGQAVTISGSDNAMIGTVEASSQLELKDLAVTTVDVTDGATLTISGNSAVEQVNASDGTTVCSKTADAAQVSRLTASGTVALSDLIVQKLVTGGETTITTAQGGNAPAIAGIEAGHNITLDINTRVGTVVVPESAAVTVTVGANTTVGEVEAKGNADIDGSGAVETVLAAQGVTVGGELGSGMPVTQVIFLDSFETVTETVAYGGTLPELPKEYSFAGGAEETDKAQIRWNSYAFTSTQPGTYTVYGSWVSLPEGVRAGDVIPTAQITVSQAKTYNVAFKDTNGLTGLDLTVVSTDGGTMFSYVGGTASLLAGRTYSYTVGRNGYLPASGTVTADGDKTVDVTLEKAEARYQVTFKAPEGIETWLNGAVPETGKYLAGTRIVLPVSHNRSGYRLVWTVSGGENGGDSGNGSGSTEIGELMVSADVTCEAKWEPITYTLDFENASPSDPVTTYTVETADYDLPSMADTESGDMFDGWYTNAAFAGKRVTRLNNGSTGNKVYYAKWLKSLAVTDNVKVTKDVTSAEKLDNVLFAEGKSVVVDTYDQTSKGYDLLVTVGGTQYLAKKDLNIFAGGYAKDEDYTCEGGTITVQGGSVTNIFGGGAGGIANNSDWSGHTAVTGTGDPSETGDPSGNVTITVNGGTVGTVYGGGSGLAVVKGTVTVNVNRTDEKAPVRSVYGGGSAPFGTIGEKLDSQTHLSKNHVNRVEIHVAEGAVVNTLQGGGISISSVGESVIRLDGTVKNRMIGAGTNGYTGSVDVTFGPTAVLEDGNAYSEAKYKGMLIYQTGFRGLIGDVTIKEEEGAAFRGDIYLGTNALYADGQNARILGNVNVEFADNPMLNNPDASNNTASDRTADTASDTASGVIYLGAGEDGTSLDGAESITISGPVPISRYLYSQKFNNKTEDVVGDALKEKVTLQNGAYWDYGFAGGSGTEEDPYLIADAEQLENISTITMEEDAPLVYYQLIDDIDLNELGEETANRKNMYVVKDFRGVLDGADHTIYANSGSDCVFAYNTHGAEFRNFTIEQREHYLNLNWYVYGDITFENVDVVNEDGTTFTTNSQNESSYCSVILSEDTEVTFKDCHNHASYNLQSGVWCGVFVGGYGQSDTRYAFDHCSSDGTVYGSYVGLFIGNSHQAAPVANITVTDCAVTGGGLYGTKFAGLFASIGNSGYAEANEQFAGEVEGAADHIQLLSVDGITAKADADGTIYIERTDEAKEKNYSYVLNVMTQYKGDNESGTSLITLDFPVDDPEAALEQKVGRILDSVTAEETYGITVDSGAWETVMINMQEQQYAYYELEGGPENETNVFYIFDADGLFEDGKIDSTKKFQINVYAGSEDGDTQLLAGTVEIDTGKVKYPAASDVKKLMDTTDITVVINETSQKPEDETGETEDASEETGDPNQKENGEDSATEGTTEGTPGDIDGMPSDPDMTTDKDAAADKDTAADKDVAADKDTAADKDAAVDKDTAADKDAAKDKNAAADQDVAKDKNTATDKETAKDKNVAMDNEASKDNDMAKDNDTAIDK